MKFLKWIMSLFNKSETPTSSKPIEQKPVEPTPSFPSGKLKIALIRGHGGKDTGAKGNGTNEVEYNTWVMDYVKKNVKNHKVECFYGDSSVGAVLKSLAFGPDISIQFHLNSYNTLAHGCEVLVLKGDTKSYSLAEKFAHAFTKEFGRFKRQQNTNGKKLLGAGDRGFTSLKTSAIGIKILIESFFIDNKVDFVPKEEYAKFVVEFIEEI
jgi:N-acetylmuramoyl-L-alanine amidase